MMSKTVRKHSGSNEILLTLARTLRTGARNETDGELANAMLNAAIRLETVVKKDLP